MKEEIAKGILIIIKAIQPTTDTHLYTYIIHIEYKRILL